MLQKKEGIIRCFFKHFFRTLLAECVGQAARIVIDKSLVVGERLRFQGWTCCALPTPTRSGRCSSAAFAGLLFPCEIGQKRARGWIGLGLLTLLGFL